MRILAYDTSGKNFSAALTQNGKVLAEKIISSGQTHAKHIVPALGDVISDSGLLLQDIDMIALTIGPGSFTGLRIGLGVAKGISYALSMPVAGISTLDCLAWPFRYSEKNVHVLMDARRGEVYSATYTFRDGAIAQKTAESVCQVEEAVKRASSSDVFCGSGAYVYKDRICSAISFAMTPLNNESVIMASDIASIAEFYPQLSSFSATCDILPVYLRRSEAEINYEINNPSV